MRSGHGCALVVKITPVCGAASKGLLKDTISVSIAVLVYVCISTRSYDIQIRAVVGIIRQCFVIPGGAYCNDISIVSSRIADNVRTVISSRSYYGYSFVVGIGKGIFHGNGCTGSSQTHTDYICTVVGGKIDSICNIGIGAGAPAVKNLYRHDGGIEGYAGHTCIIVCALGYGTRNMGAVPFVVIRVRVIIDKIITGYEICFSQVRGLFISCSPVPSSCSSVDIVLISHTCIYYCNYHAAVPCADLPGRFHIDSTVFVIIEVPLVGV
ncbi:hypothetical protein BMS3Bbin07_00368 [bacterium BMS3Bbin07]|nr:hypothetical protein BMS3Bbin07_00368 [bacterium BMS3Bbin07]